MEAAASQREATLSHVRPCPTGGALAGYSSRVELFSVTREDPGHSPQSQEEKGALRRNTTGHAGTHPETGRGQSGRREGTRGDGVWLCVGRDKGKVLEVNVCKN